MFFEKSFYLTEKTGNNALSYNNRKNKKLYVPSLIKGDISDAIIWDKIVFEDFSFENEHKLKSSIWLKNYVEARFNNTPMYIFDNHNIALFFWYKHFFEWKIWKNNLLIHIDEHSDMRHCQGKTNFSTLEESFESAVKICNVWNYIQPSIEDWLISEVLQIRSEENLKNYAKNLEKMNKNSDIILNLDLDFFSPHLDYIDYNLKKKIILDASYKAKIITVSTSPFFIDQDLALKVLRDIFS